MEIPVLSEEEFSKRYIEPFAKDVVQRASEGDEEANKTLEDFTGLKFPVGCIAPQSIEALREVAKDLCSRAATVAEQENLKDIQKRFNLVIPE